MLRRRRDDANAKSSGTSHSLHKSLDGHGKATSGILKNAYMLITTILSIAYISQLIGFDASCKDIRLHAEGRNDQFAVSTINNIADDKDKLYQTVSCSSLLKGAKYSEYNPNKNLAKPLLRFTVTEPPFWISLHAQSYDRIRWRTIWENGDYYEHGINDVFHKVLADRTEPGLVIDVGMNIGWFSLYSRAHGHHVAAFEPYRANHYRMCESLVANKWDEDGSIKIYPYGLGNSPAEVKMYIRTNPGANSLIQENVPKAAKKKFNMVQVETLDHIMEDQRWLSPNAMPIYLMKVDVEGYEPFVFGGATKLIQSKKIENIILEKSNGNIDQVVSFLNLLYQSGYRLTAILSVTGEPYHSDPETVIIVNEFLGKLSQMQKDGVYDQKIEWLLKASCNLFYSRL